MQYQNIQLEEKNDVALIVMNNPATLNALSDLTLHELSDAIAKVEESSHIRVVILTGAGKSFVAGADIAYMSTLSPEEACNFSKRTSAVYDKIVSSSKVYIAAINGYALGGGCELALACDLLIASENAKLGLPEVTLGILPGGGGTQRLPRKIGVQRAMNLILTGRTMKAQEAKEMGLLYDVVKADALLEYCFEIAEMIAKNAPLAVKYARECIQKSQELPLSAGIEYENAMFGLCFAHRDQKEGMAAFLEKRDPVFQKGF